MPENTEWSWCSRCGVYLDAPGWGLCEHCEDHRQDMGLPAEDARRRWTRNQHTEKQNED